MDRIARSFLWLTLIGPLHMIEQMLTPDEVPFYTRLLLRKISADRFPSMPMMARVKALT